MERKDGYGLKDGKQRQGEIGGGGKWRDGMIKVEGKGKGRGNGFARIKRGEREKSGELGGVEGGRARIGEEEGEEGVMSLNGMKEEI